MKYVAGIAVLGAAITGMALVACIALILAGARLAGIIQSGEVPLILVAAFILNIWLIKSRDGAPRPTLMIGTVLSVSVTLWVIFSVGRPWL